MIRKLARKVLNILSNNLGSNDLYNLMLHKTFYEKMSAHPNPLNKCKLNGFSQNEEDGITLEIIKRIGVKDGLFVEFGVGNGLENNTAILLAAGWKGAWFGCEELAFNIKNSSKLKYTKVWINRSNIVELYQTANGNADVVSLDLDGNDIYFADELLRNGIKPRLFIVEYNSKFPPPIEFKIEYNDTHTWNGDDYFGASLATFNKLFESHGYSLVCCNMTGTNAFFVPRSLSEKFTDVPNDISEIYCEPFDFLRKKIRHPTSSKTMELLIK